MNNVSHDLIAVAPGQFLGEYNISLMDRDALVSSADPLLVIAERTSLLWSYSALGGYLRLTGESLKDAKSRPEPEIDAPCRLPAELTLTTRDLSPGEDVLNSAGRSSFVK
jgi:hypothetical protein